MADNLPIYYSKILLFGEYTLMMGSGALTVPFPQFNGRLEFTNDCTVEHSVSNSHLRKFCQYLLGRQGDFPEGLDLDLRLFKAEIELGLYLDSNIPQGYGVGSSGVLVASVYARYAKDPLPAENNTVLARLKNYFSFMESFFHGKSSGLDPLSCYIHRPLLLSSPEKAEIVDFPYKTEEEAFSIFLLDTGMTSKTEGLVQLFLRNTEDAIYRDAVLNKVIPLNNSCIELVLSNNSRKFMEDISLLSELQLEYFAEMIPDTYKSIWRNGIDTGDYFLKLCGSGGGGYLLGFASDFKRADKFFRNRDEKVLPVFKNS